MGGIRRTVGLLGAASGCVLLLCAATVTARGWLWQERNARLFGGPGAVSASDRSAPAARQAGPPRRGEALARLSVPRLGIETVVVEGADPKDLSLGPGHMEGSGLPGEPDNCIIAGHRDGPFGRLRSVRPGDVVEIAYRSGVVRYRVDTVQVSAKDDTRSLAPSPAPALTLVTCYPFDYIGRAKHRFVVRASLIHTRDL